ncbi:MAG: ATP-binding cassette domain-containing protein [Deltaproteobacteria bacterium]|nr:ATP-binding cassette domain-containing protein [Deltaproteobacteria bacterium]
MSVVLEAKNVDMRFGGLKALSDVTFSLNEGELVSLIGPNGAGKTTFFNVLTGVYRPTSGSITLNGASIVGVAPHDIVARGMTRTFQNIRLFKQLSVLDNVRIGAHERVKHGLWAAGLKLPKERRAEAEVLGIAESLIQELGLKHRRDELAGSLPYGEQRRLEIARALATGARTLLLDEPAAGMNDRETDVLMHDLKTLRDKFKLTLLLIEHDMRLVMGLSERIIVLDHGVIIAQGKPAEVRENPAVLEAYLGPSKATGGEKRTAPAPAAESKVPVLRVRELAVSFGPIHALKGIDLDVHAGELVTLIGSNGAGKSTTLRAVSGMVQKKGTIEFFGQQVNALSAEQLVRLGIAHSPEGRRVFSELTVRENLELGAYLRSDKAAIARDLEESLTLFPRLKERLWQRAGTLSGGEQQMLAIARAMMAHPKLLLLDEPSLGLAPQLVEQIFQIIADINARGIAVLLVEQNANQALQTASRGYVLETGKITLSGSAEKLANDPAVRAAYFGGE